MNNTKCWIYHTWGKWKDITIITNDRNYQIKECKQCGKKIMRSCDHMN